MSFEEKESRIRVEIGCLGGTAVSESGFRGDLSMETIPNKHLNAGG